MTPVVQADGLVKDYRRGGERVHALRGTGLVVGRGELVGVTGASGSGKTTLLAVLCGWEQAASGSLDVCGRPDPIELTWSRLALLPQTLGLLDDLPARENVLLPARLARPRLDCGERADDLMAALGVAHLAERFVDEMSLGEQQRVAVARALLLRPDLLLADEPTAHQDAPNAGVVLDLLRDYVSDGGACLLVSHHEQALARADRVLRMADGVLS